MSIGLDLKVFPTLSKPVIRSIQRTSKIKFIWDQEFVWVLSRSHVAKVFVKFARLGH